MSENVIDYYPGANWASLSGNFGPEQLREIADTIEKSYKGIKDDQE